MRQASGSLPPNPHITLASFMFFSGPTRPKTLIFCTRHWWVTYATTFCFHVLSRHNHVRCPMKNDGHGLKNQHQGSFMDAFHSDSVGRGWHPRVFSVAPREGWGYLFAFIASRCPQKSHHQGHRFGCDFFQYLHQNDSCNLV